MTTSNTLKLINAIQSGKSALIQTAFDAAAGAKVDMAIEAYREAVIENMFGQQDNSSTEGE